MAAGHCAEDFPRKRRSYESGENSKREPRDDFKLLILIDVMFCSILSSELPWKSAFTTCTSQQGGGLHGRRVSENVTSINAV